MNKPTRMNTEQFFRVAGSLYGWELTQREKQIFYDLALKYTGSVVLDNWELFQGRFPGHPAWEFQEWYEEILGEGENGEVGDSKKWP